MEWLLLLLNTLRVDGAKEKRIWRKYIRLIKLLVVCNL